MSTQLLTKTANKTSKLIDFMRSKMIICSPYSESSTPCKDLFYIFVKDDVFRVWTADFDFEVLDHTVDPEPLILLKISSPALAGATYTSSSVAEDNIRSRFGLPSSAKIKSSRSYGRWYGSTQAVSISTHPYTYYILLGYKNSKPFLKTLNVGSKSISSISDFFSSISRNKNSIVFSDIVLTPISKTRAAEIDRARESLSSNKNKVVTSSRNNSRSKVYNPYLPANLQSLSKPVKIEFPEQDYVYSTTFKCRHVYVDPHSNEIFVKGLLSHNTYKYLDTLNLDRWHKAEYIGVV